MSNPGNSDPLNKISSTVSERDKKICENDAHCVCIKKETEKFKSEIARLEKETKELEREDKVLEEQLEELNKSITIQQETLHTSEQSLVLQEMLKENLRQQTDEMKKKYTKTLEEYNNVYQEYRTIYENNSKSYKDLSAQEIELKTLKFKNKDLEVKIANIQRIRRQIRDIQKQIFQTTIVKFARFYLLHHHNEKIVQELKEKKTEEQRLLREHIEVKQKHKKIINRAKSEVKVEKVEVTASILKEEAPKENKVPLTDKFKKFLSEEIQTFTLTSFDSMTQQPSFNKDNTKVRILDMKVVKPQPPKITGNKQSSQELRKKMENIVETTRKNALKRNSSQVSPVVSQQSQEKAPPASTGVSQIMTNLHLTEQSSKEKVANPSILKQQEKMSKFFNAKKKSVTFQNEKKFRNSQEDQVRTSQEEKQLTLFKFPGSGSNNKEDKPLGINPMDIFQKPAFLFKKEMPQKVEEKKNENFLQNAPFAIFDKNKQNLIPDSGTSASATGGTYSGSSYGPDSGEIKTSNETFDPFETSFNQSVQSLLNAPEPNFVQSSEPSTFNFFGSQNKTSLFNMF